MIRNKSTGKVDPAPFLAMILSCLLWGRYGQLIQDNMMIRINVIGLAFAVSYTSVFVMMAEKRPLAVKKVIYTLLLSLVIVTVASSTSDMVFFSGLAAAASSVVSSASPLAGLGEVIRTKSTESLPFLLIFLSFLVTAAWFTYGVLVGDSFIVVQNFISWVICSSQLSLFAIYPTKSKVQ